MAEPRNIRAQVLSILAGLVLLVVLGFGFLSSGTSGAKAGMVQPEHTATCSLGWCGTPHPTETWVSPWGSRTPHPTWTPGTPQGTRTANAFPTWTPMATHTPGIYPTWPPHGTGTPHASYTPHTYPTRTPGTMQPHPTWTPRATHTAGTPGATRTANAWPSVTRTTPTPRLLSLRPRVQFGFGAPGSTVGYHKVLRNNFSHDTLVTLSGTSLAGWDVTVDPTSVTVHPGVSETIGISVTVPVSPSFPIDIERVRAESSSPPASTAAYMITLAHRHPFADLSPDNWADGPVQYLAAIGAVSGYPDGTFRPNAGVTRAQFAKMLASAMGWELLSPQTPRFSDVPQGYWAYSYIETVAAHDVISGYPDGTFNPDAGVTRAQIAKMVSLAQAWPLGEYEAGTYSDVTAADWFYAYAEAMHATDVISGYADGTFRPYAPATRAQVSKILSLSLYSDPSD
jgi:hypothetical protein